MTNVLSPLAPAGAPVRDVPLTGQPQGARIVVPATPVETPRAPTPVDSRVPAEAARNPMSRERPVGPPPAFEINVLQDIRTRLADPVREAPPPEAVFPPTGDEVDEPEAERETDTRPVLDEAEETPDPQPAEPPVLRVAGAQTQEPPHQLDKKV